MTAEIELDAHRIERGVFSIALESRTLPPATHTNCVLLGEHDRMVIVDPGSSDESENTKLLQGLLQAKSRGLRIEAIVLTHHHSDHTAGVVYLQDRLKIPVWAHPKTEARLSAISVDRHLNDSDTIDLGRDSVVALHTPGHADGHLALWQPSSRLMVVGDLVASDGTILVDPHDGHMGDYLTSLERVRSLKAHALIPAHGDVIDNPHAHLTHYLTHRLEREERVFRAVVELQAATAQDLVSIAYADVPKAVWPLAVRSTMSHLTHLHELGRLTRDGNVYCAAPGNP